MTRHDLTALARGLAPIVGEYIAKAFRVLESRLLAVEQRMAAVKDGATGAIGPPGPAGEPGKDAPPVDVEALVKQIAALVPAPKDGPPGEPGKNGQDAPPVDIEALVARVVASVPVPKDGIDGQMGPRGPKGEDVDPQLIEELKAQIAALSQLLLEVRAAAVAEREGLADLVRASVQAEVAALPKPKDGQDGASVDPTAVEAMIASHVAKAVGLLPTPKDGISVTVDDVVPLIASEVAKAVSAIPAPKDGIGLVGALIDRAGHLIVTMTDGATKDVGPVAGKDGADVDWSAVERRIVDELAKWPRPKDGKDGFGFEDFEEDFDGERTLIRRYRRGDEVKEFRHTFPIVLDRGVWQSGRTYEKGDGVTWAGSFWIAQEATTAKPGEAGPQSRAWRLAVKKGTDGKTGLKGDTGERGPKGDPGPIGPARY